MKKADAHPQDRRRPGAHRRGAAGAGLVPLLPRAAHRAGRHARQGESPSASSRASSRSTATRWYPRLRQSRRHDADGRAAGRAGCGGDSILAVRAIVTRRAGSAGRHRGTARRLPERDERGSRPGADDASSCGTCRPRSSRPVREAITGESTGDCGARPAPTIDVTLTSITRRPGASPPCRTQSSGAAAGWPQTLRLPSGAGHDAQMMAPLGPMGMIFVPSVGGVSHSPERGDELGGLCERGLRAASDACWRWNRTSHLGKAEALPAGATVHVPAAPPRRRVLMRSTKARVCAGVLHVERVSLFVSFVTFVWKDRLFGDRASWLSLSAWATSRPSRTKAGARRDSRGRAGACSWRTC